MKEKRSPWVNEFKKKKNHYRQKEAQVQRHQVGVKDRKEASINGDTQTLPLNCNQLEG